jgi:Putative adhesin
MRRLIVSSIAVVALATNAWADRLSQPFDRTVDVRPGSAVSIENVNGHITVSSWDQPRVRIHAVKRASSQEALDAINVDIHQNGNSLSIVTRTPRNDGSGFLDFLFGNNGNTAVEYDVTVPHMSDLKVDDTNGAITVANVTGRIELGTTNGRIEALHCGGSVNASTTNGAIRAELVQVGGANKMDFETTNGSITLTVPPSFGAEVSAETTNGSIRSDLPVTTRSFSRRELHGTLNGGGVQLGLHTTNGSIEIRSTAAAESR